MNSFPIDPKDPTYVVYKMKKEIERLTKNEQATLKTIETIQIIRMADEAEIERLTAEIRSAFFAGCDYGSKYVGDQYLGTPERQRGFDQWK